jgi:predicted dehydrogenase
LEKILGKQNTLSVGIAGYGIVGKRRRQYIDQHPYLKTVAVCDQKFSENGTLPDGTLCFKNYQKLLEEPLNILFVSLPNYMAADVTIDGLENDLHVFCEKPPGRNIDDINRVIEVEKKHPQLILKYGFNHRYHDSVQAALQIIESGELGDIIYLRGIYGKSKIISFSNIWRGERKYAGGGILLDQGIHMLDLMQLFCGEFEEVKSFISNKHWQHDVEDNAYAIMRDSVGRVAMLHSSATQWQHRFSLDISLTKGYLELSGLLTGSKSYGEETLTIGRKNEADVGALRSEQIKYLEDPSWENEINEFADAILNEGSIVYGKSAEALAVMKLLYRIYCADSQWSDAFNIQNPD